MDGFFGNTQADSSPDISRTSSSSRVSLTPNDTTRESPPEAPIAKADSGQIKKRGRKGHSKSRTGCFNCKKARIKCKENRPSCDYCAHRGLQCEWPEIQITQVGIVIRNPMPELTIPAAPQSNLPVFTMQDFRFFQHFINTAYPHHPIDNDWQWTHDVPSMACDFDFLLHAMLALSASDLAANSDDSNDMKLIPTSILHRIKSIESLNKAVAAGIKSWQQGNAMIATCFTLLFQSVLLNDGLSEYISFLRGILTIGMQMGQRRMKFVFERLWGNEQLQSRDAELSAAPLINEEVVAAACRSFEKMSPLLKTKTEIGMYGLLLSMARSLVTSSKEAYIGLGKVYQLFMMMPHEEFREFTDSKNEVCQLLQAHFVAMQLIMTPISKVEWGKRKSPTEMKTDGRTGRWLTTLHNAMPPHMRGYYEWTLWVEKANYTNEIGVLDVHHGKEVEN
ncbi:hypothetical protein F5882DRAFT_400844 [Hyaloscypha sp. PMI_1271]|nr:hypothetical protein F5882DRAFT_400844 [Hyaloscypha sp. PMI_1271]